MEVRVHPNAKKPREAKGARLKTHMDAVWRVLAPSNAAVAFTLLYFFTFFILLNCPSDLKLTLKAQGAARDQTPY